MTKSTPLDPDVMRAAFAQRDRSFDGRFVVGVTSTGIYCRPSCPARRPRPENTHFFADIAQAESQGFRPCRRCRPREAMRDSAAVARALELIRYGGTSTLAELAAQCGYSPSHLQRIFKHAVGLTPAAYAKARKEERARELLRVSDTVTNAIFEAGYESSSRFYDAAKEKLGMTPSAWLKGGEGVTIHWSAVDTSLGPMLVAATRTGVCRVSFGESEGELRARFPAARLIEADDAFTELFARIVTVVEMPGNAHDIPLDVAGTAFQERVWQELRRIPPGQSISYGELAARLGQPKASRAVGGANGANPVAVLVPCHRVVAADGSLGGYAWGNEIKAELLRRERKD